MTEAAKTAETIIVGAGISGLALASFLRRERADASVLVLEGGSSAGGAIRSLHTEGYLAEWAPHGFLDNGAESDALVDMAGLRGELLQAPLKEYVRYLCIDGRLQLVPQTPPKIVAAPLMGWGDKIGVVARDIFRPYVEGEPSVAEWVRRRFGAAMLPFADAVYTGTYGGDIDELRIDGTMPALRALEREHGSVIFSMLARMKERRKNAAAEHGAAKKRGMPIMQNFRRGMESWPQALAEPLLAAGVLRLNTAVQTVQRAGDEWLLHTTQGDFRCRELALALPINAALALLRASAGLPVPEIPVPGVAEARLANVALGFGPEAQIPFGFGYLTSKQEGRFALGALFSSHMFPGRAPEGGQLLEALVGGRRNPEYLELDDDEIIRRTLADIRGLIDLPTEPRFAKVLRCAATIPQADAAYLALLRWREQAGQACPRLHLLGFGWRGIGINEMAREAKALALKLLGRAEAESNALKGVYV